MGAIEDDLGMVGWKAHDIAKIANILNAIDAVIRIDQAAAADDRYGFSGAIDARGIQRLHVINRGEVRGTHEVQSISALNLAGLLVHGNFLANLEVRFARIAVQTNHAIYNLRQSRGNLDIVRIGDQLVIVVAVAVHLRGK